MQLAIVLYPRFTALDLTGPHEFLARLPGMETVMVAEKAGPVINDTGTFVLNANASFDDVPAPDIIMVPGGPGPGRPTTEDTPLNRWLRATDAGTTWTASACTGSVVLAAAGVLAGRRATTHWLALDELRAFGAIPVAERVVTDGKYVTGAGVSAGIDMALTLAGRIAGDEVAQTLQLVCEYSPAPPYDAGSPETAPRPILDQLTSRREAILWGDL